MKTFHFLTIGAIALLISTTFTSCTSEPSEASEACVQLEAASIQLDANLKMYLEVWDEVINNGDLDQINESNFDKNITLVSSPENVVGIEDFKAYYSNYITGFTNVSFTIIDAFGQGDKIVKHWNFKGTHTGDFFGIPATGNEVNVSGVTLVKMKDGKIAQEQDIMDNLEFMQQLGLLPAE